MFFVRIVHFLFLVLLQNLLTQKELFASCDCCHNKNDYSHSHCNAVSQGCTCPNCNQHTHPSPVSHVPSCQSYSSNSGCQCCSQVPQQCQSCIERVQNRECHNQHYQSPAPQECQCQSCIEKVQNRECYNQHYQSPAPQECQCQSCIERVQNRGCHNQYYQSPLPEECQCQSCLERNHNRGYSSCHYNPQPQSCSCQNCQRHSQSMHSSRVYQGSHCSCSVHQCTTQPQSQACHHCNPSSPVVHNNICSHSGCCNYCGAQGHPNMGSCHSFSQPMGYPMPANFPVYVYYYPVMPQPMVYPSCSCRQGMPQGCQCQNLPPQNYSPCQCHSCSPKSSPCEANCPNCRYEASCTVEPEQCEINYDHLTLSHIEGGGIGYKRGYSSLEGLFFPTCVSENIWSLVDLRVHHFTNNELAANVGVGVRFTSPCSDRIYGVNAYYDYRSAHCHCQDFHQIGVGLEYLMNCYEFRINGYFPLERKKLMQRCVFDDYEGDFFIIQNKFKGVLSGINIELGTFREWCYLNFYGAISPYFYKSKCCRDAFGGMLRLFFYKSCFSLEGILSHDNLFKTNAQIQFALTFPFGCIKNSCQRLRVRPVYRNEIIGLDNFCTWKWNF